MNDRIERWDRWDTRLPNPKDQQRAIDLFQRSGAQTKSGFVRGRILGESFKVITVDKSAVEYYRKYCCPIKPPYTAISSLNPAEIGMISSNFKFQAP